MSRINAEELQKLLSSDIRTKNYFLEDRIGSGGFADVYKISGNLLEPGSTVLKVIDVKDNYQRLIQSSHLNLNEYKHFLQKSEREFQLIQKVYQNSDHITNLVKIDQALEINVDDHYYILLFIPYFPGTLETIAELMPFNEDFVIDLAIQCASGLSELQKHGIVHRDIKPDNIFFQRKNGHTSFQISDYGMCCTVDKKTNQINATSTLINTKFFAAPEAVWGYYSFATDIYSLGVILYWLCNDYYAEFSERLNMLLKQPDDVLPRMKYGSDELWEIVRKAVSFRPEKRYQNADEMLIDLQALKKHHENNKPETKLKELQEAFQKEQTENAELHNGIIALQKKMNELSADNTSLQQSLSQTKKLLTEKEQILNDIELSDSVPNSSGIDLSKADQLCYQGYLYEIGLTVSKDEKKAIQLYEASYKSGWPEAAYRLGLLYARHTQASKENYAAVSWLNRAAQKNHTRALYEMAVYYNNGWYGLEKDTNKAIQLLEKAAQLGDPKALIYLAYQYQYTFNDDVKAIELYTKAADLGDSDALEKLAYFYQHGLHAPKDMNKALQLYQKLISQGCDHLSEIYYTLGRIYERGRGIAKDINEAIRYYHLAIEAYSHQEIKQLTTFTYGPNQLMIPLSDHQIFEFYESRYKTSPNEDTAYALGMMYELGIGTKKDYKQARYLYETISNNNLRSKKINARLGLLYESGLGVYASKSKANKYYEDTKNSFGNAKRALLRLE